MERINDNQELLVMMGGFNVTGTIVNAFLSAGKFIYTLGQSFGSSIRRIGSNYLCRILVNF